MLHPIQQSGQVSTIFILDCCEFQTHASTGIYVPHDRLGSDLSFLNEKLKSCTCTNDIWLARFNE